MLILLIYPNISLSGQDWARILIMVLMFFLYLSVFFTLGLLVSARTNKSSTSFLVLLFIWVIFVTVIPKVSILAAAQLNPIPSVHEITAKKDGFLFQTSETVKLRNQEWGKAHTPRTVEEQNRYSEEFNKHLDELRKWATSQIKVFNAELDQDYQLRKRSQERLAENLSRISPASALMFSTMSLARTGLDEHDRFLASLHTYKSIFSKWVNDLLLKHFKFDRGLGGNPPVELTNMPQPKFEPESFSNSLVRTLPDIGLMAVLIIVFFAGAYISFLKYDVR